MQGKNVSVRSKNRPIFRCHLPCFKKAQIWNILPKEKAREDMDEGRETRTCPAV